jgi:hypothetical protein
MKTLTHLFNLNVYYAERRIPEDELTVDLYAERDLKTGVRRSDIGFTFDAQYAVASDSPELGVESLTGVPGTLTGEVSIDWEESESGELIGWSEFRILYPIEFSVDNFCNGDVTVKRSERQLPESVIGMLNDMIGQGIVACIEKGAALAT